MKLALAVAAYLDSKRNLRGVAASSAATYGATLERFTRAVGARKSPDQAAPLVEPFLLALGRRGRSDWYRRKTFQVLRDFYRWCCERGRARANPLRDTLPPILHEKPKTFLTELEVLRLLVTIEKSGLENAARDHALIATLYFAWLRVGEAVRSRPEDYDLDGCTIRVFGKGGKERLIPFDPQLANYLRVWLRERPLDSAFMFPSHAHNWNRCGRLGTDRVQRFLRVIYGPLAGLAGRVTPHTLRRSGADHARKRGVRLEKIQRVLRHADLNTTMGYLGVPSPDELRGVWRKSA